MDAITIPTEVSAAIVTVMTGIKTLGKEDTNRFQKYDFVSVDRFLEAVGPLCAAAGLVILQEEESVDISTKETTDDYGKTKTSAWLTVRYGFTLAHSSGAAYGPMHRTVMVPANGAQAFGSAQSYALKQFMRAQFQIPTGDKDDADHHQASPLPSRSAPQKKAAPTETADAKTPFDAPVTASMTEDLSIWLDQFRAELESAPSFLAGQEVWTAGKDTRAVLKREHPVVYADLENWTKRIMADKPRDAAE